jgi:hypothetical protein
MNDLFPSNDLFGIYPSTYSLVGTSLPNNIDWTQPTNSNPTSGGFNWGTVSSWLSAAASGAGTILGALNNKSSSSPAAGTTTSTASTIPAWIWLAGAGALLLIVLVVLLGTRK